MLLVPVVLAATIVGLLVAPFWVVPPLAGLFLLAVCAVLAFFLRRYRPVFFSLLFLFCLCLANLRYPHSFPELSAVEPLLGQRQKVEVIAELLRVTPRADGRSQLDLQVEQLTTVDGLQPKVEHLKIRVYVGSVVEGLLPGDLLSFKTRLREPRLFGTPGEFHWPRYLACHGIALTGWLKNAAQIELRGHRDRFLLRLIASWKQRLVSRIEAAVPGRQVPLVRALVLGEAKQLPDDVRQLLAQAGISHLFAISGLHLGLVAIIGYRLLFFAYRHSSRLLQWQPPQRVLPLFLLPALLAYLLLTGDAVSTRRAFAVVAAGAAFWWWRYTVQPLRLLMALALLFLLLNPLLLWQPAWQLSFAGAAGILLWRPLWQDKTANLTVWLRAPVRLLLVTVAATLATLPLVLTNFHQLAVAGPLINLMAVPVVALLALPVGLVTMMFSALPLLPDIGFGVTGRLLQWTLSMSELLLQLPGLSAHYLFLSRWQYFAIALAILPFLLAPQLAVRGCVKTVCAVSCLLVSLGFSTLSGQRAGLELYMFSVGQGESMLLADRNGQAVLIDGGGLYSDRFDVGERLLAPALGELGIRHLTAVLLTHDHPDHRKGLPFVLQQFPVAEFWSSEKLDRLHPTLRPVLSAEVIEIKDYPPEWTRLTEWQSGEMYLYHHPQAKNKNDSSLVLYLRTGRGGVLLTGDLEKAGVQQLLAAGVPGPVTVLKLPHHGSKYSATDQLVTQLQPDICLVSAGYRNRYGFPAKQVTDFLRQTEIPLYRTDTMGTIRLRYANEEWRIDHWQDGLFR
jgi:competence protein ComEC